MFVVVEAVVCLHRSYLQFGGRLQIVPSSFAENDHYLIAICELANGIKVLAWLEGVDHEKAKPGMRVRVEGRTSKEGNPYYVFVPA
jgi:uncharacterized OB-fold protein